MTLLSVRKLYHILDAQGRVNFFKLLFVAGLAGVFQLVGVGSVLPFMALLADPEAIQTNEHLRKAYQSGGFSSPEAMIAAAGAAMVIAILLSNTVNALAVYASQKFGAEQLCVLSERLLLNYISKPYLYFLSHNTTALQRDVVLDISLLQSSIISPLASLFVALMTILAIMLAMILVDPMATLVTGCLFGGSYILIYLVCKTSIEKWGETRDHAERTRYRIAGELLAGQREARLLDCHHTFVEKFNEKTAESGAAGVKSSVLAAMPRQCLEVIGFVALTILISYYVFTGRPFAEFLPIVSLYTVSGVRLLPQLQLFFHTLSSITYALPVLDRLYPELMTTSKLPNDLAHPLRWQNSLELQNLSFSYPETDSKVLDNLTVRVEKGTTVAFVGSTGAGKTTLINILLGLLPPTSGGLAVDGQAVDEQNIRQWRAGIGFVPQDIFLIDDTLAANIAFGVPPEQVDPARIEEVARVAHLRDFIQDLPAKLQTVVGERGVRLSGGQRQRLGIARAMYRDPSIVVFDEATSALDGVTEDAVMESIRLLGKSKTIIMIAHRITTLKDCDNIFILEKGSVVASGTYQELLRDNTTFQALAKMSKEPSEAPPAVEPSAALPSAS